MSSLRKNFKFKNRLKCVLHALVSLNRVPALLKNTVTPIGHDFTSPIPPCLRIFLALKGLYSKLLFVYKILTQ